MALLLALIALKVAAQTMTQETKENMKRYAHMAVAHWSCEHYASRESAIRDNPDDAEQSRRSWEREQAHFRGGLEAARRLYGSMLAEWDKMQWSENFDLRRHLHDLNSLNLPPVAAWGGRGPTVDFEAGRLYQRLQEQFHPSRRNHGDEYAQYNCALLVIEPTPLENRDKP
ncbi:MAG: hypothetical protein ING10_17685 [Roseomonas sp.]|nr:hypothetical protein [Roseomonas sp.]